MLIWLVFLATVAVIGFVQDDLFYLASEGRSFEELDYTRGEPYLFYIDPIKIQVFPNTSQTEQADFIFTFQLYRDKIIIGTGISMKNRKINISIIGHVKYISNDATTIKAKYCDILIGNFFLKF